MAVITHVFPNWTQNMGTKQISMTSDVLGVLLIASGTYTWGAIPQSQQFVSNFLSGDGTHGALTEVSTSGTGYTRQNLVSVTFTTAGLVNTLTCSNPAWPNAAFTTRYAMFYDNTPNTDSTRQLIGYWDFGGAQSFSSASFTLGVSGTGLVTWTSS